jgi:competence protein ComEC
LQRFETSDQAREHDLGLDLRPPVCLDLWALLLAVGIVTGTVAPPLAVALFLASLVVSAGAAIRRNLVPGDWRVMAVLSPVFVAGGVGIALLHTTTFDPLLEFAAIEPGEVVVVGRVISPPVPTKVGYRADVRVEHLWYEEKEVLRGGGIQVYANDMRVGVGDRVQMNGELTHPETKEDGFDYGQYLQTRGISGVVYARGVWLADEERGWVGQVHRRTDTALGYGLRPREGAVVRGMVLGDSSRLPEEIKEAFQRSGITHVLAISGQHVAVLAAMIYVVLRLFAVPMLLRNPATLGLVWLYIFVAGAPPSAIRAGVVATFVLAAPIFGRQLSPV